MFIRLFDQCILNINHQIVASFAQSFSVHISPDIVVDKKVEFNDVLLYIAVEKSNVIGTVMAGYSHRGWIYSIAVSEDYRKKV